MKTFFGIICAFLLFHNSQASPAGDALVAYLEGMSDALAPSVKAVEGLAANFANLDQGTQQAIGGLWHGLAQGQAAGPILASDFANPNGMTAAQWLSMDQNSLQQAVNSAAGPLGNWNSDLMMSLSEEFGQVMSSWPSAMNSMAMGGSGSLLQTMDDATLTAYLTAYQTCVKITNTATAAIVAALSH